MNKDNLIEDLKIEKNILFQEVKRLKKDLDYEKHIYADLNRMYWELSKRFDTFLIGIGKSI